MESSNRPLVALAAIAGMMVSMLVCSISIADQQAGLAHRLSVGDIMVSAITPATNTLWAADDPQTGEAWKELEDAAVVVIAAGTLIRAGGTGQEDNERASDPAWAAFADTMIAAAIDARDAARAKDIDALMTATDVMYPPCEECHLQFHPDMQE